jgi:hypothetical protein
LTFKAQKHVDPVDPDSNPEHCSLPIYSGIMIQYINQLSFFRMKFLDFILDEDWYRDLDE